MWYVLCAPVLILTAKIRFRNNVGIQLKLGWQFRHVTVGNDDDVLYNVQLKFETEI